MFGITRRPGPGLWPIAVAGGVGTGASVLLVLGANPAVPVGGLLVCGLGLLAILIGRVRHFAFAFTAVIIVGLPDFFGANDLLPLLGAMMVATVIVVLAVSGVRFSPRLGDLGFALIVLAASIPALVTSDPRPLLGTVTTLSGVYVVARITAVQRHFIMVTVLSIGAAHGLAAICSALLGGGRLLPIPDLQDALVTSRGIGFYLNPNTLGTVEAMVLVLALWWGVGPRLLPLLFPVAIGLVLSGSREALLGAAVAIGAILVLHPKRSAVVLALTIPAVFTTLLLLPETLSRFDVLALSVDPSLTGRLISWTLALTTIGEAPVLGHGLETSFVIDQAYLGWLVSGGIVGAAVWSSGLTVLAFSSRAWPVVVVMAVGGLLANTFDGPTLYLLLLIVGAEAGTLDRAIERVHGASIRRRLGEARGRRTLPQRGTDRA